MAQEDQGVTTTPVVGETQENQMVRTQTSHKEAARAHHLRVHRRRRPQVALEGRSLRYLQTGMLKYWPT